MHKHTYLDDRIKQILGINALYTLSIHRVFMPEVRRDFKARGKEINKRKMKKKKIWNDSIKTHNMRTNIVM